MPIISMTPARTFASFPLAMLLALTLVSCGERQVHDEWRPGVSKRDGLLVHGKQEGFWSYWYDNGQKQAEGSWYHDFQDGTWSWWFENGKLKQQGQYQGHNLDPAHHSSGVRVGHWRHFYDDGQLYCEGDYLDDRQSGQWTYATRDGKPFARGSFVAGVKDGEWTWFHPDGVPRLGGRFAKGVKVGAWTTWRTDGSVAARQDFDANGQLIVPAASVDHAPAPAPSAAPAPTSAPAPTTAIAPAPMVAAPSPARVAEAEIHLTAPGEPALSPIQSAPTLWTPAQEGNAAALIKRYELGEESTVIGGYDDGSFGTGDRQRRDLLGKPLPQTRFLAANGDVIDLADRIGKKPVLLVVLRGFSGQVCLYCATQTAALSNAMQKFRDLDAEVVVIYPGPVEAVPAFVQAVQSLRKDPPPMPLALDVSLLLVRALGIEDNLAKPASLIIDKQGVVRYAYVGKTIADRPAVNDLLHTIARYVK